MNKLFYTIMISSIGILRVSLGFHKNISFHMIPYYSGILLFSVRFRLRVLPKWTSIPMFMLKLLIKLY